MHLSVFSSVVGTPNFGSVEHHACSSHEGGGGRGDGGGGGDGHAGGDATVTVGAASIVTPSAVEAAAAELSVEDSEVCTAAVVVEAGTAIVAVMSTLPAVTAMVTSELSTPAAVATSCRKLAVSE